MKRSTFLASIAALILAPFGVKFGKQKFRELTPYGVPDYSTLSNVEYASGYISEPTITFSDFANCLMYVYQDGKMKYYETNDAGTTWKVVKKIPAKYLRA